MNPQQLSILYVDDSDVSLETVKDGLEALDIHVTTLRNPLSVYAAVAASKPALLLLDANMPTLDGKTICSLVKKYMPNLPIALFSSLNDERLAAMVDECGADGYIVKSSNYARVASAIRRIILRNVVKQ